MKESQNYAAQGRAPIGSQGSAERPSGFGRCTQLVSHKRAIGR